MLNRVTLRSAAAAIALTATGAQANQFFLDDPLPTPDFQVNQPGGLFADTGSQNVNTSDSGPVSAGGFSVKVGTDSFLAWCLDLIGELDPGTKYKLNNVDPFDGNGPDLSVTSLRDGTLTRRDDVKRLFDVAYDGLLDTVAGSATNPSGAAGFQIALWEIVTEDTASSYDIDAGGFKITSATPAATTAADGFLAALADTESAIGNNGLGYNVSFLESLPTDDPASQNLVTVSPVPLPAAGVLMLAALGGLAGSRKLRRRAEA